MKITAWGRELEERCERHMKNLPSLSPTLFAQAAPEEGKIKRIYKLGGDSAGKAIRMQNSREYDLLRRVLFGRCNHCGYVISNDLGKVFSAAGTGDVCNLCHDMHTALTFNTKMKNMNYFKQLHEKWEKEKNDNGERGGWRDKAGL